MNYRELQAELKKLGINAKGSKADLEKRYADAVKPKGIPSKYRAFVFTGDPTAPGQDPAWCSAHGYMFKLGGAAVTVKPEHADRLATHSHFTEKK